MAPLKAPTGETGKVFSADHCGEHNGTNRADNCNQFRGFSQKLGTYGVPVHLTFPQFRWRPTLLHLPKYRSTQ